VTVLECWYDGQGRRLAKREVAGGQTNVTQYVYDGWTVLAVLNQNGEMIEAYTRGSGIAGDIGTIVAETRLSGGAATNTYYYHGNHRGDVTAVRSTNGTTLATWDYRAFGEERSSTGSFNPRYRFSSKEFDQSVGLYYFGYRHYSPTLGRWLAADPIFERGGINVYSYALNGPNNVIDSDGRDPFLIGSAIAEIAAIICAQWADAQPINGYGDSYLHCMKSCYHNKCMNAMTDPLTSALATLFGGVLNEVIDEVLSWFQGGVNPTLGGHLADMRSNMIGIMNNTLNPAKPCKEACKCEMGRENPI
jgi:RHS repeat-associated protein